MSFKGFIYKKIMKTAGKDSAGISLARKHGLNSAEVMDYIYRKIPTPVGKSFLGKWADSIFLNFPTWKSIRERKQNLQNILFYILKNRIEKEPDRNIKILDLASGYGQYLFHALEKLGEDSKLISVEMVDKNQNCEEHIKNYNINGKFDISFHSCDITVAENYDFDKKYDIIVLAGFYDSLGINEISTIESTLSFVSKIMNDDSVFIYTYQASHVDVSLVNELFKDTNNTFLSMGERKKIDMQFLTNKASLKQIGQIVDEEGRYPIVITSKTESKTDFIQKIISNSNKGIH